MESWPCLRGVEEKHLVSFAFLEPREHAREKTPREGHMKATGADKIRAEGNTQCLLESIKRVYLVGKNETRIMEFFFMHEECMVRIYARNLDNPVA